MNSLPIPNLETPWEAIIALQPTAGVRKLIRQCMALTNDDPEARMYMYCRLVTSLNLTDEALLLVPNEIKNKTWYFLKGPELIEYEAAHGRFEICVNEYIKRCRIAWYIA